MGGRSVSLPTKMPPGTFHKARTESLSTMCWADCSPANSRFAVMDETEDRTTLMFRNLPDNQVVDDFLNLLNREGFKGTYDFAYMPMDFQKQVAVGYAFVNFTSRTVAQKAWCHFDGFKRWRIQGCDKVCEVKWSNAQQGVGANVERYRNSPVMHDTVDDKHKPRLFAAGRRVSFPAPTEKIRPPKMRRSMKRPARWHVCTFPRYFVLSAAALGDHLFIRGARVPGALWSAWTGAHDQVHPVVLIFLLVSLRGTHRLPGGQLHC